MIADLAKPADLFPDMYKDWGDQEDYSLQLGRGGVIKETGWSAELVLRAGRGSARPVNNRCGFEHRAAVVGPAEEDVGDELLEGGVALDLGPRPGQRRG